MRFVALGDSYTIGTAVPPAEAWPAQLVRALADAVPGQAPALQLDLTANLAVNGFTSGDVIEVELPQLDALEPELVSLLVGVNDVVQRVAPDRYEANVTAILEDLVHRVGAGRILAVTTPDYTVTPAGSDYGDPTRQAAAIRATNATFGRLALARGIAMVDIHDISLRAATDRSLVAADGLHPSGAQYALWVVRILPVIRELIRA